MTKSRNLAMWSLLVAACANGNVPSHGASTIDGAGGGGAGSGGSGGNIPPVTFSDASIGLSSSGGMGAVVPTCTSNCGDFPAAPIFETGAPMNAPALFGADTNFTDGGVCVLEPQLSTAQAKGALFPANWLRPRFRYTAQADLFEIRVTSPVEQYPLVAYTTDANWTMPQPIWAKAALNTAGKTMTVTIRGVHSAAPGMPVGSRGDISIAPVNAGGSMVFWTVNSSTVGPDSSKLLGFSVGDEGVIEALAPKTVAFTGIIHENGRDLRGDYGGMKPGFLAGEVQCIGCHSSTPDGDAVVFTDDWPWDKPIASVKKDSPGAVPAYLSAGARALLKMPWLGTQTMTKAHWSSGDRILVASYGARSKPFDVANGQQDRLIWINLETDADISDVVPPENGGMRDTAQAARNQAIENARGKGWDIFAMTGETGNAVTPNWSHAGDRIAYVSTDKSPDGHPDYTATKADIYTVPYASGKGGAVTAVPGASDSGFYEYYPAFSPDDKLIAMSRAPARGSCSNCPDGPYYNRYSEVYVIPSTGGTATRLAANDPVACAGDDVAKGLLNSWPKWSPNAISVDGKTYSFLIFSSARNAPGNFDIPRGQYTPMTLETRSSQLYMAGIVTDDKTGEITSYPGVYLWNQNQLVAPSGAVTETHSSNLTPAWDEFHIPPVPIIVH